MYIQQLGAALRPANEDVQTIDLPGGVVSADRILRIQRYSDPKRVRPAIRRAAEEVAALAGELQQPKASFRRIPVKCCEDDTLRLRNGIEFHCRAFPQLLAGVREVVVFVITAGAQLDLKVIELSESGEGLLEALLLETAGWLCLEHATRALISEVRREAELNGCRITRRMGPGYTHRISNMECEWPLLEQREIFRCFANAEIPVTLMSSCAMLPKMSRSGLVGTCPKHSIDKQGAELANDE
jgi:hypothetical protein